MNLVTLAHEATHWTKHEKRLNRDFGRIKLGDEGYAKEELVAEIGSTFLYADLSITPEIHPKIAQERLGHSTHDNFRFILSCYRHNAERCCRKTRHSFQVCYKSARFRPPPNLGNFSFGSSLRSGRLFFLPKC
jgi:hypothetical protein